MKMYNAVLAIQEEKELEQKARIVGSLKNNNSIVVSGGHRIIGPQFMDIGDNCSWGKDAWVECVSNWKGISYSPLLKIGNRFSMQQGCHIGCCIKITIGDNVLLGSKVYITDHYHGEISIKSLELAPVDRHLWGKPVVIGNNVWIGDGVCVMPGVVLGNNVIVGANSVVTHSFPDNAVIAGCPAKLLRMLE